MRSGQSGGAARRHQNNWTDWIVWSSAVRTQSLTDRLAGATGRTETRWMYNGNALTARTFVVAIGAEDEFTNKFNARITKPVKSAK